MCFIEKNEGSMVTVNKVPVHKQHGSVDCERFAIVNSLALCFGCFGHNPQQPAR